MEDLSARTIYTYIWDYTLYILLKFLLTLEDIQDIPDSIDLANKSKYTDRITVAWFWPDLRLEIRA